MSKENVIDLSKIKGPKVLDATINVSDFFCSEKGMDEFIHCEALDFQNELLGVTYLFYYETILVGFVTLSMGDFKRKEMEMEDRLFIGRENYPALLIGQLAVRKEFQDKDVGTYLCDFCLDRARKFSLRVGCRFLVVNALLPAVGFYEKYGFKMLKRQEERRQPTMFFNIFGK